MPLPRYPSPPQSTPATAQQRARVTHAQWWVWAVGSALIVGISGLLWRSHQERPLGPTDSFSDRATRPTTAPQNPATSAPTGGAGGVSFDLANTVIEGERVDTPSTSAAPDAAATEAAVAAITGWEGGSFPVEDFVAYTSPFGYRQHPFGGWRFHYGLDFAAPMGSYILAWWEGTVVEVSDDTACGTSIVIESGDWLHIYCHMKGYVVIETDGDRWLVDGDGGIQIRQGTEVAVGQRIGRVGMTGRTTGPHLHWGLKYRGEWVDPARVIRAMAVDQSQ
jgi:murein DD-endopeptidase MepM/ murein hydrolase activator NlpD